MVQDIDFLHKSYDHLSEDPQVEYPFIVIVEDDETLGPLLKKYAEMKFATTVLLYSGPGKCLENYGVSFGQDGKPFCLVTDISFEEGGVDGLLLIDMFKERKANFVAIAMTGFASIETAINATKKGVFHYLTKPFDFSDLKTLILQSFKTTFGLCDSDLEGLQDNEPSKTRNIFSRSYSSGKFQIELPRENDFFCGMIGRSKKMKNVFERIKKVAESDSTVFINGPSGTGKELIANAIHELSQRQSRSMVSVNCGAIPSDLLESELFGHVKGAFTGAISDRKGRFELADQGTIFLDEIGDMPLLLQVKMLRVLQNRQIELVGSSIQKDVDVRIITATHKNLEDLVEKGDFREDLYYRLNVIPITVPSLAERREDIPLLISYFMKRYISADGRNKIDFDESAVELLMGYDWPGNVRELENLIERLVILKGGNVVKGSDLPAKFLRNQAVENYFDDMISLPEEGMDLKSALSEIEDSLIAQALRRTKGNKNQASKLLHMNRTTLIEKLKKKGLHETL